MNANPFLGVLFHWTGGFASATNFIPFRFIRLWSWEVYWIIQGFAAWIVMPLLMGKIFVPDLLQILSGAPHGALLYAFFWGMMWGIGGLTFGLAIRYLGIALGYAIALGFCTAFGTLMPPIFSGEFGTLVHSRSGRIILLGIGVCLLAILVNGVAGYRKEQEIPAGQITHTTGIDLSFGRGVAVAVFAGVMSSCFAYGLAAGKPIASIARDRLQASHGSDLWQNLPVLVVVLWGGFLSNFLWSVVLIVRNHSGSQFIGGSDFGSIATLPALSSPRLPLSLVIGNYLFATLAGVLWYLQFFFYSMGQARMGKLDFSSWTLHMASIILFATLWGIVLREWRGTSKSTKLIVAFGLLLLLSSTLIVGLGNYVKVFYNA